MRLLGLKNVKWGLVIFILTLGLETAQGTTPFENEKLNYVISYKWGVIHKDAGEATLTLKRRGTQYDVMLAARTKPWADKFYMLRDTLSGKLSVTDLTPLEYIKATHEKNYRAKDVITYNKSGNTTTGNVRLFRYGSGTEKVTEKTLTASGPVYDMLTVFYYLRKLDYSALNANKIYKATVFSGSMAEVIRIRSLGKEKIKLRNKQEVEAYHIKFNFTREGGKKSSDDIDTWISTDPAHIPLYLVGKLPVGEVRAYYLP